MLSKRSTALAKQFFRDPRFHRAIFSLPDPIEQINKRPARRDRDLSQSWDDEPKPSDRDATRPNWPSIPADPRRTVCIHNVPRQALTREVLDLVISRGPIYHVEDADLDAAEGTPDARTVAVTFFKHGPALSFLTEVVNAKRVDLYGHCLSFSWGTGPTPHHLAKISRALMIPGLRTLGPDFVLGLETRLKTYGPLDQIAIVKKDGEPDRAYINFLSANNCMQAAEDLYKFHLNPIYMPDRCVLASRDRDAALHTRARGVRLDKLPPQTSVADLLDQIRGGALENIAFMPNSGVIPNTGVAYANFIDHAAAMAFHRHAVFRGIIVHNQRLAPRISSRTPSIPEYLYAPIHQGASRCLEIEGVFDPDALRKDCERHGPVERVSVSESISTVSFLGIREALAAYRMLGKKEAYTGHKLGFICDPCAAPYDYEKEEAANLQAQLASLLIPPEVQEPSSNTEPPSSPSKT
ncbi:hypothetical protein DFH09DRAFT_457686 [Mycena vulgaris]|nr:hypothetical protein DFH09DRAFT_457686 [Mycena vulgaris]